MELPTKERYEKMELLERIECFRKFAKEIAKRPIASKALDETYISLIEGTRKGEKTLPNSLRENFFDKYVDYKTFKTKKDQILKTDNYKNFKNKYPANAKLFIRTLSKYEEFLKHICPENIADSDTRNIEGKPQDFPLNQILYGPPGTGKTYNTVNKALEIIYGEDFFEGKDRAELKDKFENLSQVERIVFTTFHQSMSYEDFIEGIKPKLSSKKEENEESSENQNEDSKISYEIKSGIFRKICTKAEGDPENEYILIIDEINRGNVSQIFGELITLIEEDKRLGNDEELEITLPYSGDKFGVPNNLYIIGTMNTADRSVEALDTALRRRFSFIEMMPDYELEELKRYKDIDLPLLLKTINERIEKLLDREHQIGHSYFLKVEDLEGLKQVFKDNIIPLLQEYFFGDYGKIGLVLGENFFDDEPSVSFKKIKGYDDDDFKEKKIYRLKDPLGLTDADFKSIYMKENEDEEK